MFKGDELVFVSSCSIISALSHEHWLSLKKKVRQLLKNHCMGLPRPWMQEEKNAKV